MYQPTISPIIAQRRHRVARPIVLRSARRGEAYCTVCVLNSAYLRFIIEKRKLRKVRVLVRTLVRSVLHCEFHLRGRPHLNGASERWGTR